MAQEAVECRYMGWNFYSEGTYLANDWRWATEVWRTNEIRDLSSPHRQRWVLYYTRNLLNNLALQKCMNVVYAKRTSTLPGEYRRKAETQKNWLLERTMVECWGLIENNV